MKNFNVALTLVNGEKENVPVEAISIDGAIELVTNRDWLTAKDEGRVRSVNMKNVVKAVVNEVDEDGFTLDEISF